MQSAAVATELEQENPLIAGLERLPVRPTSLVIFGATGDLAHRKLLPALYNLAHEGALPERFELIGVARTQDREGAVTRALLEPPAARAGLGSLRPRDPGCAPPRSARSAPGVHPRGRGCRARAAACGGRDRRSPRRSPMTWGEPGGAPAPRSR